MVVRSSLARIGAFFCVIVLCSSSLVQYGCGGQECYFDTACTSGQVCQDGKCVAGNAPSCTKDSDCSGGQKCYSARCVTLPAGFEFPTPGETTPEKVDPEPPTDTNEPPTDTNEPPSEPSENPTDQIDGGPDTPPEIDPDSPGGKVCQRDLDCVGTPGEICSHHSKNNLRCLPQNATGLGLGVTCDPQAAAPGECRSKICHPKGYCTTPCIDDKDCPGGTGACVATTLPDGSSFKLCSDSGNSRCFFDLQCSNTLQCIIRAAQPGIPGTLCGNGVGASKLGDACFSDSECSYNVCIGGQYCSQPCLSDEHCKAPFVCGTQSIEFPTGSGKNFEFKLCKLPPDGLSCKTTKDCLVRDNQCSPKDVSGTLELRCQSTTGTKVFRDVCTKDTDCASRYCLDAGLCSQACEQDADCPTVAGFDVKCLDFDLQRGATKGKLKACVALRKSCTKDGDCASDETCAPFAEVTGDLAMKCIKRFDRSGGKLNDTCAMSSECQTRYCNNSKCANCSATSDCATGEVCVAGYCTTTKPLGADCTKADDCHSKICYKQRCSLACANNNDCNKTGYGCTSETITDGGKSFMGQICTIPQGGLPCFTSADCPSAQNDQCSIVEVNGVPVTRCRAKVGSKTNGEACTQDSDCVSGSCLQPDGTCTQSCSQDSDCTATQTCQEREFKPSGGGTAVMIKVCGLPPCTGDAECGQGQLCVFSAGGGNPFLRCQAPDASKKDYGTSCTQDSDCQSGLCSGGSSKACVPACQGGKSQSCPLQYDCEMTASGTGSTHLCEPTQDACVKDGDCQSGQVCVLTFDAAQRPVRTCKAPVGARKVGAICDPNAQPSLCETGYCDARTNRCASLCSSDSDCPSGGPFKCSTATFAKPQGQTGPDWQVKYCRYTGCDYDGHCESTEVCQVSFINNALVKRCVAPSGKKAGEACSSNSDCASGMCQASKCSALCAAHRHCAATEYCNEIQLLPGQRTKGCTTGARSNCVGNADCPQGQVCQANFNTGGDAVTECKTPKANEKADGQPCTPGAFPGECASHLCDTVTKTCLKTCDPGLEQLGDCRVGKEVCQSFPLLTRSVTACLPPSTSCQKASDCPSGSSCAAQLDQQTVSYLCARPSSNQPKKVGDACDPAKTFPGECETHLCHPTLKICVNTCTQDSDCGTARPRCGKIELSGGVFANACIPDKAACETDANCPSSQPVCALELSSNMLSKQCGAGGPGTKKVGESCDPTKNIPGDCINRFCEEGTSQCVATCETDDHCPSGLVCSTTFVEQTRQAKACVKPVNSACTHATDCPRPLACVSSRETTQIASKCQTPSGADLGAACTPVEVTASSGNYKLDPACKSNLCSPTTGQCTSPCRNDADCGAGKCKSAQIEGFQVNICDASCQKDADCPTGQVCGAELDSSGDVRPLCITPAANTKAAGSACDPTKVRYAECQSGVCGPSTSTCLALCAQDSDCGTGQICDVTFARTATSTLKPIMACVPDTGSCTSQTHCGPGYLCGATKHGGNVVVSCFQTSNTGNEGTACNPSKALPGDCHTGLCDAKSMVCTTPCTTNADCTNGTRTTCGSLSVEGTNVNACIEP